MGTYKKVALFCAMALMLSGCSQTSTGTKNTQSEGSSDATTSETTVTPASINPEDLFSDRDFEIGYDETTSAQIQLNGSSATCNSDAVTILESTVTITDEGTYVLTGNLKDGMVIVDAEDTDKVQLVLNDASITKADSASIYIKEADKVFITTNADTENTLSNGGTYTAIDDNNIDAVIFSKADLTLNGAGTLTIHAKAGHGIVSKDDVIITSGTYDITAQNHGISGKDCVGIANGTFTIESGKDGVHAENTDDTSLGYVYMEAGTFDIQAQGDGISAENILQIQDGEFKIQTGEGSEVVDLAQKDTDKTMGNRPTPPTGQGNNGQMTPPTEQNGTTPPEKPTNSSDGTGEEPPSEPPADQVSTEATSEQSDSSEQSTDSKATAESNAEENTQTTETEDTSVSMKGLKATSDLVINGGTFEIDTEDDALHSNENVIVSNGKFQIATGDDAMHADSDLTIADGTVQITKSYEGLEGQTVTVNGGEIELVASDDGINAAGGNDQSGTSTFEGGRGGGDRFDSDSDANITITGGAVSINADGDGIDSNGNITMSGGEVYVLGPNNTGNASLDYGLEATITGGTFIAAGTSQMAQNFGDSSTQGAMLVSVGSQEAGTVITLLNEKKEELLTWTAEKSFDTVIISCPEIQKGSTYTLSVGSSKQEITMDNLIYGTGSEGGRGMGGHPSDGGRRGFDTKKQEESSTEDETA